MVSIDARIVDGVLLESYAYAPGPAGVTSRHVHEDYQIGLSLNAPGEYWYRRGTHAVPAGSVSVLHPGEPHAARDPGPFEFEQRYAMLYVPPSLVETVARGRGLPHAPFIHGPIIPNGSLLQAFLQTFRTWYGTSTRLARDEGLYDALGLLLAIDGQPIQEGRVRQRALDRAVRQARGYLHDRAVDSVSLQELSALTGVSPYHLTRAFRATVGVPPHAYQLQLRVDRAKKLMLAGVPLSEVASEVGFSDQSHLGRHFRRLVSIPPGRYRQRAKSF